MSLVLATSLLASGVCEPKPTDDEMAPPFGLKWGMTVPEFIDLYRAKNGDAAAARLVPDKSSGVESKLTLTVGTGAATPAWPPMSQAKSGALEFSDEFGLVSVTVTGEDIAGATAAATYDDALKRYGAARAALIRTYGEPTDTRNVNLGETPQEKMHCLDDAMQCSAVMSDWYRPVTTLLLTLGGNGGTDDKDAVANLVSLWEGPHWEQNLHRLMAADRRASRPAAK